MNKKITIYDYRQLKFKEINRVLRMLKRKSNLDNQTIDVLKEATKTLYVFFRKSIRENIATENVTIVPIKTKDDEFKAAKILIESSISELEKISKEIKVD